MRVLFTTPYPASSATGVGRLVRSLAEALRANGDVVSVVEPSADADAPGFANLLLAARTAREMFRHRDADVVHCQTLHLQSLVAALLGRVFGKAVVITVHGPSPPAIRVRLLFHAIEWCAARVPHRLVLVASFLKETYKDRSVVIPNGVPVARIRLSRQERARVRTGLGIGGGPVVVYVGRITEDKGIPILVGVLRVVRKDRPGTQLLLVGPIGEGLRPELGLSEPSWIHWVGPVDDPIPYLVAADVFVLPSLREGTPLSLLEAMAAEVPVIASAVGGVPEVVDSGVTGLLVPPGQSSALREALERVLSHPSESAMMARRAADVAQSRYDSDQMARRYRFLYELIIGQSRSALSPGS